MRFYDKNSWKKKIDPAFDKPIKTYLKYLREIEHLPNDGQVTFQDEFIELISKNPNLLADYNNEFKIEMLQFNKNIGLVTEHESELLLNTINTIDEYNRLLRGLQKEGSRITISQFPMLLKITSQMHSLIKLAEKLPEEESKQYYANKINVFIKDIRTKHFFQFQKDFESILLSIFIRVSFNGIDESNEKSAIKEDTEHLKNPIVINKLMGFLFSTISQISYQKDMRELLNNVEKGDDKSLFKAITIDKTLTSYEPVKNRIIQAQASGDKEFLNKLGKATAKSPLESFGQHGKTYAVLKLFWNIELYKLNNQELYYFLKSCGLKPPAYQDAFDKFMQRHIK